MSNEIKSPAPHPGETPQKVVDFVWTDELVKIFALQEINVYKNFDRAQLDHWMDRFKNQQSTESLVPGERLKCVCSQEPGDQNGCLYPDCQDRGELSEEAVPSQQGEVPEDIHHEMCRAAFEFATKETFIDDMAHMRQESHIEGAIYQYHRDQEQIKALQSQLSDFRKVLEYARLHGRIVTPTRTAYSNIGLAARDILDKYPSGSNI